MIIIEVSHLRVPAGTTRMCRGVCASDPASTYVLSMHTFLLYICALFCMCGWILVSVSDHILSNQPAMQLFLGYLCSLSHPKFKEQNIGLYYLVVQPLVFVVVPCCKIAYHNLMAVYKCISLLL